MANLIGLQIAGRDPGYTTFLSIDWSGERLADSSDRALSTGDVYHTVKFEREYWTYESVVCNFLGSDNREAFIKIGLRLPARTVLADAAGREVSPVDILAKIRSVLADNNLKRRADRYVLDSAKTFDSAFLGAGSVYGRRPQPGIHIGRERHGGVNHRAPAYVYAPRRGFGCECGTVPP